MIDMPPNIKKGQKGTIKNTKTTVNGTLYKNETVKVDEMVFPDNDIRVVDGTGKIWYIDYSDIQF
jgi:hypothetical protein